MRTIKVKKSELIGKLEANLKTHIRDYKDACEGYRAEATNALLTRLEKLKRGETVDVYFQDLAPPESHENDYKVVISMMQMSVDEIVEVSTEEFQCYCMDDWAWKQNWSTCNSKYQAVGRSR